MAAVGLGYVAVLIGKQDEVVSLKGSGDETGKLILSHIEQEAPLLKHLHVTNSSFTELCCFVKAFEQVYYMYYFLTGSMFYSKHFCKTPPCWS